MPIYVYRCEDGHRFERLVAIDAEPPPCPECGGGTRKLPAGPRLGGRSGPAPAPASVGTPDKLEREVRFRQRLADIGTVDDSPGP